MNKMGFKFLEDIITIGITLGQHHQGYVMNFEPKGFVGRDLQKGRDNQRVKEARDHGNLNASGVR